MLDVMHSLGIFGKESYCCSIQDSEVSFSDLYLIRFFKLQTPLTNLKRREGGSKEQKMGKKRREIMD